MNLAWSNVRSTKEERKGEKSMKNLKIFLVAILPLAMLSMFVGCSDDSGGGGSGTSIFGGTSSPGDAWEYSISGSSFTLKNIEETRKIEGSGSIKTLPSGFQDFAVKKVKEASKPERILSAAEQKMSMFPGLLAPGLALFTAPLDEDDGGVILMGERGSCDYFTSTPIKHTWLRVAFGKEEPTSEFGTLALKKGDGSKVNFAVTFPADGYIGGGGTADSLAFDAACANNKLTWDNGGKKAVAYTNKGKMTIIDLGLGQGGLFAVPHDKVPTLAEIKGVSYMGLVILSGEVGTATGSANDSEDEVVPIAYSKCAEASGCPIFPIDIDKAVPATSSDAGKLKIVSVDATGKHVTATIADPDKADGDGEEASGRSGNVELVGIAYKQGSSIILVLSSAGDATNSDVENRPYTILLISR